MSTASTLSIAHVIHDDDLTDFPVSAGYDRIRFLRPTMLGDTVTVHYVVETVDRDAGRSIARIEVTNQRDELVAVGRHVMRWTTKLKAPRRRAAGPAEWRLLT
ncbi:MAG: MaoC family dehydratase [Geminicoccaceae bacterium]